MIAWRAYFYVNRPVWPVVFPAPDGVFKAAVVDADCLGNAVEGILDMRQHVVQIAPPCVWGVKRDAQVNRLEFQIAKPGFKRRSPPGRLVALPLFGAVPSVLPAIR